jgi:hypothetical protein
MFGVNRVAINRVDEDFIKDFQESWGIPQVLLFKLGSRITENPIWFDIKVDGPDVRVRSLENVLDMGELLYVFHIYLS